MKNFKLMLCFCWAPVICALLSFPVEAQRSLSTMVKGFEAKADEDYRSGSFGAALVGYSSIWRESSGSAALALKIARCHFGLAQYEDACYWFDRASAGLGSLAKKDLLHYAEALSACKRYEIAIRKYRDLLELDPDNELIRNKVWRLSNFHFLYEDSLQYAIQYLSLNSESDDFGAVEYDNTIIFLSNRPVDEAFGKIDGARNAPFFRSYVAEPSARRLRSSGESAYEVKAFARSLRSKYHNGTMCFYDKGKKMVFTTSSTAPGRKGAHSLHLTFAEKSDDGWKVLSGFEHNSNDFSNADPYINEAGNELYFTSDRPGGFGGKDIYRSLLINGKWSAPENLGSFVNTSMDETHPFVYDSTFYFSSNGHPGLGGFDVFKCAIGADGLGEIINMGYPVNSHRDDFGLKLSAVGYRGFLTSNRRGSDDIFEVVIDQQSYPLRIDGVVKLRENNWMRDDSLKILGGAKLFLFDHTRNRMVGESESDDRGRFSLTIPYFSFFKLRVVQADGQESLVSLEIPRHKKEDYFHEIVVVEDAFGVD